MIDAATTLVHRTMLTTLYSTGMRCAELSRLIVGDIDSQRVVIHIRQGKGSKDRDVPLSSEGWIAANSGAVYWLAVAYGHSGDLDKAILWLNRLYEMRGTDVLNLRVDPDLDPLRSDPRFQDLIRRIGLP